MYQFNRKEYEERMKWYQDARFGMFIHWGLYSIPARGEWVRSTEEIVICYLPFYQVKTYFNQLRKILLICAVRLKY